MLNWLEPDNGPSSSLYRAVLKLTLAGPQANTGQFLRQAGSYGNIPVLGFHIMVILQHEANY